MNLKLAAVEGATAEGGVVAMWLADVRCCCGSPPSEGRGVECVEPQVLAGDRAGAEVVRGSSCCDCAEPWRERLAGDGCDMAARCSPP